jgi:hypothetical protein
MSRRLSRCVHQPDFRISRTGRVIRRRPGGMNARHRDIERRTRATNFGVRGGGCSRPRWRMSRPMFRFRRHRGFDFAVCDDKSISRVRPSGSGAAALAISLQAIFKAIRLQPVTRDLRKGNTVPMSSSQNRPRLAPMLCCHSVVGATHGCYSARMVVQNIWSEWLSYGVSVCHTG